MDKHAELKFLAGEVKEKGNEYQFGFKADKVIIVKRMSKN